MFAIKVMGSVIKTATYLSNTATTATPGKYVSLDETIKGFTMVLNGDLDDLPEQAFYLVGNIDEAVAKAKTLQ